MVLRKGVRRVRGYGRIAARPHTDTLICYLLSAALPP
jgi:hypothetical protein